MPIIHSFEGVSPTIHDTVFLAENASIIGDVHIGRESSIWYGAVIRGDVYYIRIGEQTSIQDNTVIHITDQKHETIVGNRVTVGHSVTLHGCHVGDRVIVGMGCTILDQAIIGDQCIVGAGALVPPGLNVPSGHLVVGVPARVKRPLTEQEKEQIDWNAAHYVSLTKRYETK